MTAVVAALLFTAPTALATPPVPRPPDPHDIVFIGHLVDRGVPYASSSVAITLAQATCRILTTESPTRIDKAVRTIRDQITMRPDQVQSFAETAVSVYCPSCADQLGLKPDPVGPVSPPLERDLSRHPGNRPGHNVRIRSSVKERLGRAVDKLRYETGDRSISIASITDQALDAYLQERGC